jgi:hypothetical protein
MSLRSIHALVADPFNISICYNAIRDRQISECKEQAENIFGFSAYIVFQGLTNAEYFYPNSTDSSLTGPMVQMLNSSTADTLFIDRW